MLSPLLGKTLSELQVIVAAMNLPKFTARQMADWLYKKRITTIDEMTNLSLAVRQNLSENYVVGVIPPTLVQESKDGTKKYLFSVGDQQFIEAVMIPEADRKTLCVSSQIGCKMGCKFCVTGKMGFHGNLTAHEIMNQIYSIAESQELTNWVFMGMGEPFDNMDELMKVLDILTADWGFAKSPRRITVSSIGVIPMMQRFLQESECHLAVSLHSPFAEERKMLMPVQNKFPIAEVVQALRRYDFSGQRRVSFEYILFENLNDSPQHAQALVRLLSGIRCRVNLIRFHASPNTPFHSPDEKQVQNFLNLLNNKGITATIRASRGEDIQAACGLLSTQNQEDQP
ncbi:MAG: 23S rRNA (adenine(2503)-C(2))-methyltransferase RlmN [Bacteroidales bacterium]|nr:23S rRNA (adenine(2503)-C(2))-methyltransferase RlmN [Bacteroidales bacterium]